MFFPFLPQERYKNNPFKLELSRCTFVWQLFSSCFSIIPEGIKTMGPVGFEPTTASAPGKYLSEIKSNEMVSLTKLDDGPLRLTQRQCFLNVVLLIIKKKQFR
jgi:hypothetical protein